MDGSEIVGTFIVTSVVAVFITLVADGLCGQHWNFLIVWLICLAVAFGGFLIIDTDGDWDIW